MNLEKSGRAAQSLPMSPPSGCQHNRLISESVSEEERKAGKVRCVECASVVPDPYLLREGKQGNVVPDVLLLEAPLGDC